MHAVGTNTSSDVVGLTVEVVVWLFSFISISFLNAVLSWSTEPCGWIGMEHQIRDFFGAVCSAGEE